jgi:hypothetical protein
LGKAKGKLVGLPGFERSPEPPVQVCSGGVRQAVIGELAPCQDGIDQIKARYRPVPHRHRDGTVQFDNGGWIDVKQNIVQVDDLGPIGRFGARGIGMDGGDDGLQRLRAEPFRRQGLFHQYLSPL